VYAYIVFLHVDRWPNTGCVQNLRQNDEDSQEFGKQLALLEATAAIWGEQVMPHVDQSSGVAVTDKEERQKWAAAFTERWNRTTSDINKVRKSSPWF
jgi:hypothetical protein